MIVAQKAIELRLDSSVILPLPQQETMPASDFQLTNYCVTDGLHLTDAFGPAISSFLRGLKTWTHFENPVRLTWIASDSPGLLKNLFNSHSIFPS